MQGSLNQVPLPEVLQFISMGKSSGMLHLRRGNTEITLYIQAGRIINSSSIERRRRLGDLLVHRGLLKRSELAQLLNLQRTVESDKRLGQILVERDIISEDTIRETLRLQLEEEIWNLFAWDDGEFKFEQVDESRLGDAIVTIEIEPLILEGSRRNDEWQKIQAVIPHDDLVLSPVEVGDSFQRDLNLRPQEWRVLAQVNGQFTVKAIVNRSNMGRFEVHRILSQFLKTGLLQHADAAKKNGAEKKTEGSGEEVKSEAAPQAEEQAAGKKGGLLGLIGGGKKQEKKSVPRQAMDFISPIGLIAHFTNVLAERLMDQKEYSPAENDEKLYEQIWRDLLQTYTKADMVEVHRNTVDTRQIETFFSYCEYTEPVDECYEDALEGLLNLLQIAFRVFAQRVGERAASRVVRELLDEMGPRATVRFRGPFPLVERVQNILRLVA
ncbi:DUF4388 domain-containing protein [bacterium]|nr:DUF4388 domain-containing protein [bacterium]